jgi:hypothetical protein
MAVLVYKWLMAAVLAAVHPFYVSVTEIDHNAKNKTLEISCKMFLDDTEKALEKAHHLPVELTKPKNPQEAQRLVSDYIRKHFLLKVDGKPANLEFAGYEVEGASIWSYFQVSNIAGLHRLDITNTILYEMYDGQISIMHAKAEGQEKSIRINNPVSAAAFAF